MNKTNLTILGAGAFGSALGQVLTENGHQVVFYDPKLGTNLSDTLKTAEIIVLAVPSAFAPDILVKLPHNLPLIIATKGLLLDTLFADFADYMVLSGPGFAADIKNHQATLLTATDPRIIELFGRPYLNFDITFDRRGVLMCGALKNVYAILAGYENFTPDSAAQAKFLTEVAGEMQALLSANQADPATVALSCGQGDLKITCAPPSRNFEFGQILRKNSRAKPTKTVEGVTALTSIRAGEIQIPTDTPKLHQLIEMSKTWA